MEVLVRSFCSVALLEVFPNSTTEDQLAAILDTVHDEEIEALNDVDKSFIAFKKQMKLPLKDKEASKLGAEHNNLHYRWFTFEIFCRFGLLCCLSLQGRLA